MDIAMVDKNMSILTLKVKQVLKGHKRAVYSAIVLCVILFAVVAPRQFANLWLTPDQQGYLLYKFGYPEQAARYFSDTRWTAYSFYTVEKFDQSALLYGQYLSSEDMLAQANSLAHGRHYVKARDIYEKILKEKPDFEAAQVNKKIVQTIIDDVNRFSESQREEGGQSGKDLGDEPQTGDGAERATFQMKQVETLSADQLLLDPSLNEMWLRQVQKDPARFLGSKFHQQFENRLNKAETNEQ